MIGQAGRAADATAFQWGFSHEAEHRDPLLDDAECAFPQQQPGEGRDRQRPPLEADAGRELEGDRGAADLGREHEEIDEKRREKRPQEEVEAEALADRVRNGVMAIYSKSNRVSLRSRRMPMRHQAVRGEDGF